MDDDVKALPAVGRMLAQHGVTSYFPTTVTAPIDVTLRALGHFFADAIENRELAGVAPSVAANNEDGKGRAAPLGIHLEGPFISHVRRGVTPRNTCWLPRCLYLSNSGRQRAGTFA